MNALVLAALLGVKITSPDGDLYAFPSLLDDRGTPIAVSTFEQWVDGERLHVRITHAFPDGPASAIRSWRRAIPWSSWRRSGHPEPPPAPSGEGPERGRGAGRSVRRHSPDTPAEGHPMPTITLRLNGRSVTAAVETRTLLVELLRERLGLTGTHVGCDTSQCGACTVHVDGRSVKSCTMLAVEADGGEVTTIEGLATDGELHPMQKAFHECHGLQCGFCTPGMVMSAVDLVRRRPDASEKEIREWLEGNLCRCTGYHNIVKAVQAAAKSAGR